MQDITFIIWNCIYGYKNVFHVLCFYYQDLLQLQYEGVAVMKMFDKAKVNVNLLIFLLNKKFYGKWKSLGVDAVQICLEILTSYQC